MEPSIVNISKKNSELSEEEIVSTSLCGTINEKSSSTDANYPEKSKSVYLNTYKVFLKWKEEENINVTSEDVLLDYFTKLSKEKKPSSLWPIYSMLKSALNKNENLDISDFKKLLVFLKQNSAGFVSKSHTSRSFNGDQIAKFLQNAPDKIYLGMKVVVILAISGPCKKTDLYNITVADIRDNGTKLDIKLPHKIFSITGEFYNIYKKYYQLRSRHKGSNKLLLSYTKGTCCSASMGKNFLSQIPKQVAKFLKLDHPEEYVSQSLTHSSAEVLRHSGISSMMKGDALEWGTIETDKKSILNRKIAEVSKNTNNEVKCISNEEPENNKCDCSAKIDQLKAEIAQLKQEFLQKLKYEEDERFKLLTHIQKICCASVSSNTNSVLLNITFPVTESLSAATENLNTHKEELTDIPAIPMEVDPLFIKHDITIKDEPTQ